MRLWARTYVNGERVGEGIVEIDLKKKSDITMNTEKFIDCLTKLAAEMDLERPVILQKHIKELCEHYKTIFRAQDFMESVDFDRLVVELIN